MREMVKKPGDPEKIVKKLGIESVDSSELQSAVKKAVKDNPGAIEDFLAGREEALNFLAGKVMAILKGRADPREVVELLRAEISK